MKRLVRWSVRLYPEAWRARYGVEMEALLEDAGSGGGDLSDIVRGALFMRMTSLNFWHILAGCTLAGVLAAGIWTATLPARYVSTAVMRIGGDQPSHDRLQAVELAALSRASLAEIILRPSLNLYSTERKKIPLQDVIEEMRSRDLRIRQVDSTTFAVQFASENPGTAQATVRALVDRLMERNAAVARDPGSGAAAMEVVNPATLPPQPEGPQRRRVMGSGLGAGLLLGLGCGTIWSITRRKERWNLRRIGGFAVAGMALGVTIAWLIPNEFVSTAVLRTADGSKLQSALAQALSEESLAAIIREEGIFSRELRRNSMNDVARKMRHDFIRVQVVEAEPAAAVTISFRYWDRLQAQQVTRDLVWRLVGPQTGNEVVDPANLPAAPIYPNRLNIVVLGTVAGILLGWRHRVSAGRSSLRHEMVG